MPSKTPNLSSALCENYDAITNDDSKKCILDIDDAYNIACEYVADAEHTRKTTDVRSGILHSIFYNIGSEISSATLLGRCNCSIQYYWSDAYLNDVVHALKRLGYMVDTSEFEGTTFLKLKW